jgi:hypothetical protein
MDSWSLSVVSEFPGPFFPFLVPGAQLLQNIQIAGFPYCSNPPADYIRKIFYRLLR